MLEGFLDRFKELAEADEHKLIHDALEDNLLQAEIIDLNQLQLYDDGIQSDGSPTGDYSLKTIQYKLAYGDARQTPGRIDHVTGNNTGETYDSMQVDNQADQIEIKAEDRNGFFKVETEGLGLTDKNIEKVAEEINARIIDKMLNSFAA